jgi:hypothetical protein
MRFVTSWSVRRARILGVGLALVLVLLAPRAGLAATQEDCRVAGGWFFTQTGGGQGPGYAVLDAGTDSSGHTIAFWTEFQRFGGVTTLGYPIGQPYVGVDGFTYQPFQRAVLQWRPELQRALLSNIFEILTTAGQDDWLVDVKGIPRPIIDDGSGGDYSRAVAIRLGWLTNDAIRAFYVANPNPSAIPSWNRDAAIQLYGLPMSRPEQHGPFVAQRFQRIALQLWTENVAGMPAPGTVVGVLGGDMLKAAGGVPTSAVESLGPRCGLHPPLQVIATVDDPGHGSVQVRRGSGEVAFLFETGMRLDADGAPEAYHPPTSASPHGAPPALDDLRNAGNPGNWWALVVQPNGQPVVQQPGDPAPGFYVSMTSLVDPTFPAANPRRYVDATQIPYVVLPPSVRAAGGASLGDLAAVYNRRTGLLAFAIFADSGPAGFLGEGSIALARVLGVQATGRPILGGQSGQVVYIVFPTSGNGLPRGVAEINSVAGPLFAAWGGIPRIMSVVGD